MPKIQPFCFVPVVLLSGLLLGAGPAPPSFEGLVEVSEVLIDVLATNEDGEVVLGLGKEDFVVEEGGRPVDLTSVSYYSTRYSEHPAQPGEDEIPSSRYLVLFFHDTIQRRDFDARSARRQLEAGRESQEWLELRLQGSDWVAVVSYDFRLKVHQDFTQDREAILFAVEMAISRKDPDKYAPRRRLAPSGTPSILRRLPKGKELRRESRNIFDATRTLAESVGYIVGRKNLLLFTFGFSPRESVRYYHAYEEMRSTLNDHNVAVYPMHLGGRGVGQPHGDFLAELAEETGGDYFENIRDFSRPLETIGRENHGYYVLSYQSEHPAGEIGFERVEVKAVHEEIRVRARKGYRYGL